MLEPDRQRVQRPISGLCDGNLTPVEAREVNCALIECAIPRRDLSVRVK